MKNLTQAVKIAIARVQSLNAFRMVDGQPVSAVDDIKKSLEGLLAEDKAAAAEGIKLLKAAHDGNTDARQSLNALRVETINNFIYPSMNFAGSFFEVTDLGPADRPVVQNETKQQTSVGYIGEDGEAHMVKLLNPQAETLIPLKVLSTDEVTYRLSDVYNGDVSQSSQRNVDIAFDMANQMDALAYTLYTAALGSGGVFGNFVTTGTKVNRVYVPNSRINTANLPTTNELTLSDNGAATKVRLAVCRAILAYCDKWANAFPDGPLRPTGRLIVPSLDAANIADEITPTGSTSNSVVDQILLNYTSFSYMGVNWQIVPDNTIAPKVLYAQLNKPVGKIYTKSSMDEVYDEANRKRNYGSRSMRKVAGFYIPAQHRVRALKVTYRT